MTTLSEVQQSGGETITWIQNGPREGGRAVFCLNLPRGSSISIYLYIKYDSAPCYPPYPGPPCHVIGRFLLQEARMPEEKTFTSQGLRRIKGDLGKFSHRISE